MSTERNKYPGPTPNAGGPDSNRHQPRSGQAGTRMGPPRGDGRSNEAQRKRNQETLRVGDDHKTPEMKKHRRGTFP